MTLRRLLRCVISGVRVTVCLYHRVYRRTLSNIGSVMIFKSICELQVMIKTEDCVIIKNAGKMTQKMLSDFRVVDKSLWPGNISQGRFFSEWVSVVHSSFSIFRYQQLSWNQKTWPPTHTRILINKVRYYRVAGIFGSDQVEDGGIPVGMYPSSAPQCALSSILLRTSLFNSEVSSMELNRITYLHLLPPVSSR